MSFEEQLGKSELEQLSGKIDWCEFSRILHHTSTAYIMKGDEAGEV